MPPETFARNLWRHAGRLAWTLTVLSNNGLLPRDSPQTTTAQFPQDHAPRPRVARLYLRTEDRKKTLDWQTGQCHVLEPTFHKLASELADVGNPKPHHTLHPAPYTSHPVLYTLHPTPYTLHPTPYTLHPTTASFVMVDALLVEYNEGKTGRNKINKKAGVVKYPTYQVLPSVRDSASKIVPWKEHLPYTSRHQRITPEALGA